MKNIHLLDADKPSRLFYLASNLHLEQGQLISPKNYQNIYITSDDKIKMGDWYIIEFNGTKITKCTSEQELISIEGRNDCQKIILTTNPVLISNGVQAIDDEFLEWFIKNPSCEFVDWEYKSNEYIQKEIGTWGYDEGLLESEYKTYVKEYGAYKIIIPKEEPKQVYYNTVGRENGVFVIKGQFNTQKEALDLANDLNKKFPDLYYDWNQTLIKEEPNYNMKQDILAEMERLEEEPKQETLEEVAEKMFPFTDDDAENRIITIKRLYWIDGVKWQQERSYNGEEVKKIAFDFYYDMSHKMGVTENLISENSTNVDIWFEEYKNNDEIIDDSIFDIKMDQPTNQSDKIKYFNYFLYKLYQHKGSKNDFGKNKINPLFFFLLNAVDGYTLYDIFDDFYALPYGPIEKTINHLIKNQEELSFTITRFDLDKKSDFTLFQDENTKLIDKAFDRLVTTGLIEKSVSYIVDLSMEHESLLNARRNAIKENKLAYPISNDDLKNELKFFYE